MQQLVDDIAEAVRAVDTCGQPFKDFQCGVGPYGEPQLAKKIVEHMSTTPSANYLGIRTSRQPDLLVPGRWAIEIKIVRPFGDNGREAENWSQNLLHPYHGNVSAIGDIYKLLDHNGPERRAVVVIGYEHEPPQVDLSVLVSAFELLARELLRLPLGEPYSRILTACVHPVHQRATVHGWAVG